MKTRLAVLLLAGMLAAPVPTLARNLAVPPDDPVATLSVPDDWKREEIDYGYSFASPGKDVLFYVEYSEFKQIDAMMANNKSWMKENGIDGSVKPEVGDLTFGGMSAKVYQFNTKDENGPTVVEFIVIPAKKDGVVFLTVWGSNEERKKHGAAIDGIFGSIKAIQ